MKKTFTLFIFIFCFTAFSNDIFVSIPPQKFFVEKIAGSLLNVEVLIKPGQNPHSFDLNPGQMIELSKSNIYFTLGLEFEDVLIPKISSINNNLKIIPLDSGIRKIISENTCNHGHDDFGVEEICEIPKADPHIWLSPRNVKIISLKIKEALENNYPENKEVFQKNYLNFIKEIDNISNQINTITKNLKSKTFLIYHPAWAYFARDFDLTQLSVETDGKEPGPKDIIEIIKKVKQHNIKTIFIEPAQNPQSPQVIAKQAGLQVKTADPLDENWSLNIINFAESLK
ncbi:MAG: zinc ABC transporter substrate-binding protein [Candidatus Muiribacteriota bacterium]|jgi:zinc transport system substrate-binding protein